MSGDANRLRIAIAGGSDAQQEAVRSALGELNEIRLRFVDTTGSAALAPSEQPEVVMILLAEERDLWGEQTRLWRERANPPAMVALVPNLTADGVKSAVRAGADEVLGLPLERTALSLVLTKLNEQWRASQAKSAGAKTLTMISLSGGAGTSTLLINLAFGLIRRTGKKVAVVDLDLQQGALAVLIDAEAEHSIAELVDPTTTIDSIRLESVMWKHESGLYLLAAPKRLEHAEMISSATVAAALEVMKQMFDYVLVDGGHHITESSIAAWEHSEQVVYPIEQTVTSVRGAQRFLDLWARLKLTGIELGFLLNRFDPASVFNLDEIQAAIKHPVLLTVPRDDAGFARAQLVGNSIWDVEATPEARAALERLVNIVCGIPAERAAGNGLFRKMRSMMHLGAR